MNILSVRQLRRFGALALGGAACLAGLTGCGGDSSPAPGPALPSTPLPPAPPVPQAAPVIASQPVSQTVNPGQDATFTVSATGTGPLSYQWTRNGVAIAGATAATYILTAPKPVDSADVLRVNVRNAAGAVDSEPAVLQVAGSGVRTIAGAAGKSEYKPALFGGATGIALHPGGGVYQTDNTKLLRIATDGKIATLADPGCYLRGGAVDKDGNFLTSCDAKLMKFGPDGAQLPNPAPALTGLGDALALAIDAQGVIHVADRSNNTLWRVEAGGAVVRVAGRGTDTSFTQLGAVAVDPRGGVIVADQHALRTVSRTGMVSTLAGSVAESGAKDGKGGEARFYLPDGLVVDAAGTVYVSDTENRIVRKVSAAGEVSTLAGGGGEYRNEDGTGKLAGFFLPRALTLDAQGNLLVTDTDTLRKITPGGSVTTVAGTLPSERQLGWIDGAGREARFSFGTDMVRDGAGNLFVADTRNHAIRKVTPAGIVTTLVGGPHKYPSADGTLATAALQYPGHIALGPNGVLYVTDGDYPFLASSLRKITADGVVSTVVLPQDPRDPRAPDGSALPSHFVAVAADSAGNVFVAGYVEHNPGQCGPSGCERRVSVRRLAPDGKVTVLLTNEFQRVPVSGIGAMVTDRAGNLYVLSGDTILTITPAGAISILLAADSAGYRFMTDLAIDAADNVIFTTSFPLFTADFVGPRSTWRYGEIGKVTPQGVLSVLATPYHSDPAVSSLAWTADSLAIAVDAGGALYLSSYGSIVKLVVP